MSATIYRLVFRGSTVLFAAMTVAGIVYSVREWHCLPPVELDYTSEAYASLTNRDDREAVRRLTMAARLDWHSHRPTHLYELAKAAVRVGDQEAVQWAVQELRQHTRRGTAEPETLYYFAVVVLLQPAPSARDLRDALRSCTLAAERLPDNADVQSHLGMICSILGRPESAERHFRRALQLDPANPVARYGIEHTAASQPLKESRPDE